MSSSVGSSGYATQADDAAPGKRREAAVRELVTDFAHGFVSMELSGTFQMGGDVDEAFRYGVDVLVGSLAAERPTSP
jgi:hypothetical protein